VGLQGIANYTYDARRSGQHDHRQPRDHHQHQCRKANTKPLNTSHIVYLLSIHVMSSGWHSLVMVVRGNRPGADGPAVPEEGNFEPTRSWF